MTESVSSTQTSGYSSAYSFTNAAKASTEKLDFLNLLTLQLKSQNPLKPYDNQEFASQLAQFSQLEQLTGIRSLLEEQKTAYQTLTQTMSNSALPGLLGKNSKASWNSLEFDGENSLTLGYNLPAVCSSGEVNIYNSAGQVVKTIDLSGMDLKNGEHKFEWNGKDNSGNTLPTGQYYFKVNACSSSGSSFSADTYIYGKIQAVRFTNDGTKLVMNGTEIPLQYVQDISI